MRRCLVISCVLMWKPFPHKPSENTLGVVIINSSKNNDFLDFDPSK